MATSRLASNVDAMTKRGVAWLVPVFVGLAPLAAQTGEVRGRVTNGGRPLPGVNVFVLESLEGGQTDSLGWFSFPTGHTGAAELVARRIGFAPDRRRLVLPTSDTISIELTAVAVPLPNLNVEAGRFVAADQGRVQLTSLDVVRTPGTAADVYRAIQTFPGLQAVNEGAGLFVRGGDVTETKILLNDAVVLAPYRYESPTGGFFGAFDPFLLDGIYFSSGGFPVRYGDALSGVAALNTLGRPARRGAGVTAGLAGLSANLAIPLPHGLGARATGTRTSTDLLFRVNGTTSEFTRPPEGRDLSASAIWSYGAAGEIKVFAIDQWSGLGVVVDRPSYRGAYQANESHGLVVGTWTDRFGRLSPTVSVSRARAGRVQEFGAFELDGGDWLSQLHARLAMSITDRWSVGAGGELESRRQDLLGSVPATPHDNRPGARRTLFHSDLSARRSGVFLESDWQIGGRVRAVVGARTDRASTTGRRTVDPRVSLAWRLGPDVAVTGAWGWYHQVPNPLAYESTLGNPSLPSMRAQQWVVGLDLRSSAAQFRLEGYHKRYRDLAQTDRAQRTVGGGQGRSNGVDLFLRWSTGLPLTGRLAYSWLSARRTDPNTGLLARSPFDVTHTATLVLERPVGRLNLAAAWRLATGRPFTPVIGAVPDTVPGVWIPEYGSPYVERLPAFVRMDVSASLLTSFFPRNLTVFFIGISNALNRTNVFDVQYNDDYSERTLVRSQFKRSIYVGATMQWS